jgi:hypothetical protein
MTTILDIQGRRTIGYLTNKSGGSVAKGDVVVIDSANDEAFKTSTAGAEVVGVGVVIEDNGIANNAQGRVAFQGYVALVNVNASVTRGNFGKTHTVAKQATDAGASRVLGVFCQFLTGGTTPAGMLFGQPDGVTGAGGLTGGTPALTLGTSNAAGAAATGIRTDATIAAFDATVPVTQASGDAAATGSAGVAARRDHKHGMPTLGTFTGYPPLVVPHGINLDAAGTLGTASRADAIPVIVPGIMLLRGLLVRYSANGTGTVQWGLFDYSASQTAATKLAGGTGTLNAGGGAGKLAATGAPVTITPGAYLIIFLQPSANQPTVRTGATSAGVGFKTQASYTWDDTPDLTAGWSDTSAPLVCALYGDIASGVTW